MSDEIGELYHKLLDASKKSNIPNLKATEQLIELKEQIDLLTIDL
jgi:hypothetical protein